MPNGVHRDKVQVRAHAAIDQSASPHSILSPFLLIIIQAYTLISLHERVSRAVWEYVGWWHNVSTRSWYRAAA